MIRIKDICKTYRTDEVETWALNNVNLTVHSGEFLSVMGRSGSGKSSLLNIIGLMDAPTSGEYYFDGVDLAKHSEAQRAGVRKTNIGMIFQSFNLIDELSVYQNVELALLYQKVPRKRCKARVMEILDRVGIEHRANHYPQQLSGGQQQRVAIARAVVGNPRLLLADEPTGNLDTKNGVEVMELLKSLNAEGATVIFVTHSEEFAGYGSRVVRLQDGVIEGSKQSLGLVEEA